MVHGKLSLLKTLCGCIWSLSSQRLRWYCEEQHLIFCCQQILWKWIEKRFRFFSQLASVNWTSWISTRLIKYLQKSPDSIIWSSNLRTTIGASNTPNIYSSGALIPLYTSNQFINVCFHRHKYQCPFFNLKATFILQECLLIAIQLLFPMPLLGYHQVPNILKCAEHHSMINYCSCMDSCIRGPLQYSNFILGYCSVLY